MCAQGYDDQTEFQWRPQDTGEARTVGLLLRKAESMKKDWLKREGMHAVACCRTGGVRAAQSCESPSDSLPSPRQQTLSCSVAVSAWLAFGLPLTCLFGMVINVAFLNFTLQGSRGHLESPKTLSFEQHWNCKDFGNSCRQTGCILNCETSMRL